MILGRVDKIAGTSVFGWAFDNDNPAEHLSIEVFSEGEVVATGTANLVRADLKAGGFGTGDHAFEIQLLEALPENKLAFRARSNAASQDLDLADPEEHKFSELYDIIVARYDGLFSTMLARSEKFEQGFHKSLNDQIAERHRDIERELQGFNARLEAAEVSLFRVDQMVRTLVEKSSKRKKRFLGLF